jgi:hypothetical protein
MNVQHWLAETSKDADDVPFAGRLPACAKVHFIHGATGKLLGERQRQDLRCHAPIEARCGQGGSAHRSRSSPSKNKVP